MATTLSDRMNHFSGSPTSALIAKVAELKRQGKDIISLNVGEPDFGTPDYIKVAGMKAIADNFTKYTPGNGILELRQEIVKKLKNDNGVEYALNEITTGVGAKQVISSAMMVIAGPGDEVLIPIPCWVSYTEMVKLAGATPVFVPVRSDNYELDMDAIEKAITPKTKGIIICTPNNPTGAVYSEESLRRLAELAVEHDFFIVADEIYEKLIYDGAKHFMPRFMPSSSISNAPSPHTMRVCSAPAPSSVTFARESTHFSRYSPAARRIRMGSSPPGSVSKTCPSMPGAALSVIMAIPPQTHMDHYTRNTDSMTIQTG